jgi:hypothetical protein
MCRKQAKIMTKNMKRMVADFLYLVKQNFEGHFSVKKRPVIFNKNYLRDESI